MHRKSSATESLSGDPAGWPRPLRVAHTIDSMSTTGGTEVNAVKVVEHLSRDRIEPVVLTLNDAGGMRERYENAGVEVHAFPVSSLVGWDTLPVIRRMASLLRERRVDVVHTHDCYTNFLCVAAARLAGVGGIVASKRWTRHEQRRHEITDWIAFRFAHRVVANSRVVGRSVSEAEGISPSRVVVVPNFVNDALFADDGRERREIRDRFGLTDAQVVVGIVAQLRREKDHPFLLRAFRRVADRTPEARLLIVGDGPDRPQLESLVRELALTDLVLFAGHMPDAQRAHRAFDVSTLVSQHEGFPNSVVEAMAAGRPVVATRVGGIPDAVQDGLTGLLVDSGNEAALADSLITLVRDPSLRSQMGASGRSFAADHYTTGVVIPQLERLYAELANFG